MWLQQLSCVFVLVLNIKPFQCHVIRDTGKSLGNKHRHGVETCLSEDENPYTLFDSKTSYLHPDIGNRNTDEITVPGNS